MIQQNPSLLAVYIKNCQCDIHKYHVYKHKILKIIQTFLNKEIY